MLGFLNFRGFLYYGLGKKLYFFLVVERDLDTNLGLFVGRIEDVEGREFFFIVFVEFLGIEFKK